MRIERPTSEQKIDRLCLWQRLSIWLARIFACSVPGQEVADGMKATDEVSLLCPTVFVAPLSVALLFCCHIFLTVPD